jgi:aldehyde:ferredoxin oxidoreductase
MAFIDRLSTLGRGGFGAVMGSKNLKAIIVKGNCGIKVTDRKKYKNLSKQLLHRIREYPHLKESQDLGLVKASPLIPIDVYKKIKKRRMACVSCPIGDKDVVEIADGEFKGFVKCSTSVMNLAVPLIYGFQDYREAIRCTSILDEYGLDLFEFFGVMGFAKALYDNHAISKDLIETEIRLDSFHSMKAWANKITYREGLSRKDETPPEQWLKIPGFKNYLTENPLTRQESEQMIEDYYDEWGWDRKTGIPIDAELERLGLVEI